jgi:hypothetical protein
MSNNLHQQISLMSAKELGVLRINPVSSLVSLPRPIISLMERGSRVHLLPSHK